MKICILKESLCLGGTERSAANISRALSEEHEVCVAVYDASQTKYAYGGEMVDFNVPAKNGLLAKILNNVLRIYKYFKLIKDKEVELLYEFISINNPISTLKHKSQIRIISARDFSVLSTFLKRFNKCLKNSDAMICNSKYLRSFYINNYPEHKDKVFALHNIIDSDEISQMAHEETEKEFGEFLAKHPQTVVSVGRFCKEKGVEYLIESISLARQINKNVGLVLIGDGNYKNRYIDIIKKYNLSEHIYMAGFQKNPYKYMSCCTCFVLSSLSEGFPNVLAEAMALGLPVIATNCCSGPAEILRNDENYNAVSDQFKECDYGLITPEMKENDNENAVSQLAAAINILLSNPEMIEKYSALSKKRALDFSKEAAKKQLNNIFDLLLERRNQK